MQKTCSWKQWLHGATWLGVGAVVMASAVGCSDQNKDGTPEIQVPSGNQVAAGVKNVANTVEKKAGPTIAKAAVTVKKVAAPVVAATEDEAMAAKVKTAIIANQQVDSSKINVDVKKNNVILRGRVKSTKEKVLVQTLAQKQAAGYKITNQLQLEGAGGVHVGGAPANGHAAGGGSPVAHKQPVAAKKS